MLPDEIRVALGESSRQSEPPHLRLSAGLDSILGETHLVAVDKAVRIWARDSVLAPLTEVEIVSLPELAEEGWQLRLVVRTAAGERRISVSSLDREAIQRLLDAASPREAPAAEAAGAPVLGADLDEARAALLGQMDRMGRTGRTGERPARKPKKKREASAPESGRGRKTRGQALEARPDRGRGGRSPAPAGQSAPAEAAPARPSTAILASFALLTLGPPLYFLFLWLGRQLGR